VAAAHEIRPHVLAAAAEVASRLQGRARDGDRLQLASHEQAAEQLGVLAVALDAIARGPRRLRGGDDVDPEAGGLRRAIEREASGAGLVAGVERLRELAQPGEHGLAGAAEARAPELAAADVERGSVDRAGVDVQTRECHRCGHGRTLLPLHGVSRSQSPAR